MTLFHQGHSRLERIPCTVAERRPVTDLPARTSSPAEYKNNDGVRVERLAFGEEIKVLYSM